MDANSIRKIIEDRISALEGNAFQEFCDRLGLTLYPNDYTPVRAGGRTGDDKNDGYCPKARVFFQAHATRGETVATTKNKIENDLDGCVKRHRDINQWIYLTNIPLLGTIETFIDQLRENYLEITIESWDRKIISGKISTLHLEDIEYIIDINLSYRLSDSITDLKQFENLLETANWSKEFIDRNEFWICNENPMFQVEIGDGHEGFTEKWTRVYPDEYNSGRYPVNLKINGITIKQIPFVYCDGGRIKVPLPEVKAVNGKAKYCWERESLKYKLGKLIGDFYIYENLEGVATMSDIELV